jgi:acyl-CoA synthetase (AMP-forming)/AMP-acid ligase II
MSASEQPANLADMVRARAKARGNAIVYEFEGRQTSFAEFDILTNRVANALTALGVKPGERIAYLGKNSERIAGFKTPKTIDFIEALPRNASGKMQCVGENIAPSSARSVLGEERPPDELARHCEEQQRRSNPASGFTGGSWIASLRSQ